MEWVQVLWCGHNLCTNLASNPGSLSWEERRAWYTLSAHAPKSQKSWEFGFFRKISCILLRVLNVNYPWHYCVFRFHRYLPGLLVSAITKRRGIDYFCLGKVPKPVGSWNFERQERDLAIGDSVGLRKLSSLFEVLDDYFLPYLFYIDIVVFQEPTISILLHGAFVCLCIFSWHARICAWPTCFLVVIGQFYGKISVNVGACTVSVYQALLSSHEREPSFEASTNHALTMPWICMGRTLLTDEMVNTN